jgi:hypothetical protein
LARTVFNNMASHLERLRRELEDAIDGADYIALQRGPAGKWNSATILEHLYVSYKSTNFGLAKCLEKGAPFASSATLKQWRDKLLVVDIGYMPNGIQAPKQAIPRGLPPDEVRSNIFSEIEKIELALADCKRRFGAGTKIMDHPFLGPLTANEWSKLHLVHGRHHAKQIRQRIAGG